MFVLVDAVRCQHCDTHACTSLWQTSAPDVQTLSRAPTTVASASTPHTELEKPKTTTKEWRRKKATQSHKDTKTQPALFVQAHDIQVVDWACTITWMMFSRCRQVMSHCVVHCIVRWLMMLSARRKSCVQSSEDQKQHSNILLMISTAKQWQWLVSVDVCGFFSYRQRERRQSLISWARGSCHQSILFECWTRNLLLFFGRHLQWSC